MPGGNIRIIRNRIASVKNTQKITRAMKLVAAARLRRAQENIVRMRPFAQGTLNLLSSLAARTGPDEELHPLLARREEKNVLLVVLTSDRGLAGSFNANASKAAYRTYQELTAEGKNVVVGTIGRKGHDFLRRRNIATRERFNNVYESLSYEKAVEIGDVVVTHYTSEALDSCYLIYNEFKSAMTQTVKIEQLLPIQPVEVPADETLIDYVYEPDQKTILDRLLPLYVHVEIYRALLESVASEHGARMTAMDNATRNAKEMIDRLTLQANRARQAAITTELMEIIGGAEALKG
jgi:F-type H+-transporting ATPase subunit gamma